MGGVASGGGYVVAELEIIQIEHVDEELDVLGLESKDVSDLLVPQELAVGPHDRSEAGWVRN